LKKFIVIILAFGTLFNSSVFARNEKHVRVVLDLSQSLSSPNHPEWGWPTDPGRLLILSTLLLHDLVQPNSTLGDSFEVIPFENDGSWKCHPNAPLPTRNKRRAVVSKFEGRDDFVRAIQSFKYDAPCTYFYPGIRRAMNELKGKGGDYDTRVIILITDGVPEKHVLEEESRKIQELFPDMKENNIRLYVLAFGQQAWGNQAFFRPVNEVGGFEVIPDNKKLLGTMVKLFQRSFGYTADEPQQPNIPQLNLEGNVSPERAVVVVLSDNPTDPPLLNLKKPKNGVLNLDGDVLGAKVTDASYSLQWVLAPSKGDHPFSTDIMLGTVVVLRPTRLLLEIRPSPPETKQTLKTMAKPAYFPLKVLVKPPLGVKGDPGMVKISFRTVGERLRLGKDLKCPERYSWCTRLNSVKPGPGKILKEGREYEITDLQFEENQKDPNKPYIGYLEVIARRGDAEVASKIDANAHRVEVYPYLSLMPVPLSHSTNCALAKREKYCTDFSLKLDAGYLPHPNRPQYSVRAILEPGANLVNKELDHSRFTLDGLPLEFKSKPNNPPGEWNKGRLLEKDELLGTHELCVRLGKPGIGSTSANFNVPLKFTLLDSPYDDFQVVKEFNLKMRVVAPLVWPWIVFSILTILGLFALFWYSRFRPTLAPDLGYALGVEGGELESMPLGKGSPIARLLGFVVEKPISLKNEGQILAWVRPLRNLEELYQVRPAKGVTTTDVLNNVEVQQIYRLKMAQKNYRFRLEYQDRD
jgi:hypothetical protein